MQFQLLHRGRLGRLLLQVSAFEGPVDSVKVAYDHF